MESPVNPGRLRTRVKRSRYRITAPSGSSGIRHGVADFGRRCSVRIREQDECGDIGPGGRASSGHAESSCIVFADRGTHVLKGVPDDWQIYAVTGESP